MQRLSRLDVQGAGRAAPGRVGLAAPGLDLAVDIQRRLVRPSRVRALGGQILPVAPVAARPDSDVDARTAAEAFAQ
jgi:hypothetical protein